MPAASPVRDAHAVYLAREFAGESPFLHLVGDHVYAGQGCAQRVVQVAQAESCSVSAVQPTRESLLPHYGTVGGQRIHGHPDLYRIERVLEKPTPTEAEQQAIVPGLRAGHYLCFFGMHVLTPTVMEILGKQLAESSGHHVTLSGALAELAAREQYLALEVEGRRYDLGVKYGLLAAQVALALGGRDRNEVLSQLVELLALRTMEAAD
jgi:UTP--glucose-1-phosphate uridylyltransferase